MMNPPSIALNGYHGASSSPHPTPLCINGLLKHAASDDVDDRGSLSLDDVVIRAEADRSKKRRRQRGQLESEDELHRRIKTLLRTNDVKT